MPETTKTALQLRPAITENRVAPASEQTSSVSLVCPVCASRGVEINTDPITRRAEGKSFGPGRFADLQIPLRCATGHFCVLLVEAHDGGLLLGASHLTQLDDRP